VACLSCILGQDPDGFPFEGDADALTFLELQTSVSQIRNRNLEIIIILTLFEKEGVF